MAKRFQTVGLPECGQVRLDVEREQHLGDPKGKPAICASFLVHTCAGNARAALADSLPLSKDSLDDADYIASVSPETVAGLVGHREEEWSWSPPMSSAYRTRRKSSPQEAACRCRYRSSSVMIYSGLQPETKAHSIDVSDIF